MARSGRSEPVSVTRSERFRASVEASKSLSAGESVLVDEACRLVDRLDRFDAMLAADVNAWCSIDWPFEDAPAALVISSLVTESRQTVAELRQVVKALGLLSGGSVVAGSGEGESPMARLLQLHAGGA